MDLQSETNSQDSVSLEHQHQEVMLILKDACIKLFHQMLDQHQELLLLLQLVEMFHWITITKLQVLLQHLSQDQTKLEILLILQTVAFPSDSHMFKLKELVRFQTLNQKELIHQKLPLKIQLSLLTNWKPLPMLRKKLMKELKKNKRKLKMIQKLLRELKRKKLNLKLVELLLSFS